MITTVTANPAVDYNIKVSELKLNEVNRAQFNGEIAGGKGINVSKAVKRLRGDTQALGCVGGRTGEFIEESLNEQNIKTDFNWTDYKTRVNVNILDDLNNETRINLSGEVSQKIEEELNQKVIDRALESDIIVLSGSLPTNFSTSFYHDLITKLDQFDSKVFLDTSGEALKLSLSANPDLIKPNQEELEEIYGRELSLDEIIEISQDLVKQGIEMVLVSRGKEGAVLTTKEGTLQAVTPQVKPASTVGAGDGLVAGMAVGYLNYNSVEEVFKFAVAESIATILRPGAEMGTYEEAEEWKGKVEVERY